MLISSEPISSKKSKLNKDALRSIFSRNSKEFCKNTTLHGLKYIADNELYPRERLFFGVAFITVIVVVGYFIQNVLDKWSTTPVIYGPNPFPSYIHEEPFPSVTICNLNVAYKSKAEQFSIYSTEYAMLQMLCKRQVNGTIAGSISDWSNLNSFMEEIAQPCSNMILSCRFGSVKYNCSELFEPIITDEGLCCVFNKLHPDFVYRSRMNDNNQNITKAESMGDFEPVAWSSESGYQPNLPKKYYPRPAVGAGETLGLSLTLDVETDEYYCSSMNSIGFKISLHSPMETPSLRENGLLVGPGRETKILLTADKFESEQNLRGVHYTRRQCLFQDEMDLQIFSQYTHDNCETECVTKLLLKYCGCITFYSPRIHGNESICSIYEATCVERTHVMSMLTDYNRTGCEQTCLPSCHDINYIPYFFSAPLRFDGFHIVNQIFKNMSSKYLEQNVAVLHIYHKEFIYRGNKQSVFFGGTDALSSIGGLISLFVGFSFISLVEFIFYGVLRPLRESRQIAASKSYVKVHPRWQKPIRKRHKCEIALSPYRNPFREKTHEELAVFRRKWYSERRVIAGIDKGNKLIF